MVKAHNPHLSDAFITWHLGAHTWFKGMSHEERLKFATHLETLANQEPTGMRYVYLLALGGFMMAATDVVNVKVNVEE